MLDYAESLNLPACPPETPAAPAKPKAPTRPAPPPPATLAVTFWQTVPLPVPQPSVPPGWALCGKPAYLVTGGTVGPTAFHENTPLGPLTITAHGAYLVNWDDPDAPGWAGPYPFQGQPWPNGTISHTYDNTTTATVAVEEQWTATWTLAGQAGTLNALHTLATVPGFAVRQIQPIITS
jgi:hypothetical protein